MCRCGELWKALTRENTYSRSRNSGLLGRAPQLPPFIKGWDFLPKAESMLDCDDGGLRHVILSGVDADVTPGEGILHPRNLPGSSLERRLGISSNRHY